MTSHTETNPWPNLDARYYAAKLSNLGDQLRADELTERVRLELENAFAAGALWQHGQGACLCHDDDEEMP